MMREIDIESYLGTEEKSPLIDVRSPGEYEKGHIPGAINIPLFTNDERAHVGTVYKQKSKEKAIELGYEYVNPKLQWFIDESRKVAPSGNIVIHCWRGGMRSHSFAQHLADNGFSNVGVITGGYKAYRKYILSQFERPMKLRIIGGYTGSGKTYILKELQKMGKQVIDLEGLAHHKGSAFGAIGESPQPTVEQFENDLYEKLHLLNTHQDIWLEDESHSIGGVKIPMGLFSQMRQQQLFFLNIPKEERAKHLVTEYTHCNNQCLIDSINRISKRLGGQNVKEAIELIDKGNYQKVAMIALQYYDKSYVRGTEKRDKKAVTAIPLNEVDHSQNAKEILKFVTNYDQDKINTI
ncbi:tRNA 2-selenouridine(34) synthase MnmH [Prolixibacteraceae bacterium JC049]|nr:tRNA 2-selenouridine(34) synthase MnmH [Prolixibacteraceae bacterium JC049]